MTTVFDIYSYIDSFAPFDTALDWDNVGILVGDKSAAVTSAVVSLDITNSVADEARSLGAQLIISHHPVIFGGVKKVLSDGVVYRAASYGLSCICAHTNLDKSPTFGVNTALCDAVGCVNSRVSEKGEILFLADTPEPLTPKDFAEQIKRRLGHGGVAFTDNSQMVSRVGVCSGGGGGEIYAAASEGCDGFVTGEIKHHELLFANEHGISVFVLGHFKSEDVVIEPLVKKLSEQFPEVQFVKSSVFDDGVRFL